MKTRRRLALSSLMMTTLLLSTLRNPVLPHTEAKGEARPTVAAYVYDSAQLSLSGADAAHLDQLIFSFGLLQNGRVSGAHWRSIGTYSAYIAAHPHITPILAVGGWGADGFSQAAASKEGREQFVESALQLMDTHGFLGLDIDWEYPGTGAAGIDYSPNDGENFTKLIRALREALNARSSQDGKTRFLSVAVGATAAHAAALEISAISPLIDQFNVMTYDLQSNARASHHTALYGDGDTVDSAVNAWLSAGVPASKLMIGAASYGRAWAVSGDAPLGQKARALGTVDGTLFETKYPNAVSYYDEKAQATYLYDGSTFVSYDSPRSVQAKATYVRQRGLMGMMIWKYDGTLVRAMRESLP